MKTRMVFGAILVCVLLLALGGVALAQTGMGWFVVSDDLWVQDDTRVDGDLYNGTGAFTVTDDVNVTGAVDFDSTLNADGAVTFNSTLDVDGNVSSGTGAFTVTDDIAMTGALVNTSGAITVSDDLYVTSDIIVVDDISSSSEISATNSVYSADFTSTDDIVVGDDFTVTDDTLLTDDTEVRGILTLQEFLRIDGEALSVTQDGIITPTASYMELSSAGTVSTASIAAGTEGDFLFLVNVGAQTIVISDTGNLKLSSDWEAGANDAIILLYDGTNWNELAESDN